MTRPPIRTSSATAVMMAVLTTAACHAQSASQAPPAPAPQLGRTAAAPETFDLVVYGSGFHTGQHEVFLRTNPDHGAGWVSIGTLDPVASDAWAATVFPELQTERFLGQDFRESYLDLKIVTAGAGEHPRVSAIYAMPHVPPAPGAAAAITRLIETRPRSVEALSIASMVQPAPVALRPDRDYVEHVRAPLADPRPGVLEVLQLIVEWRNREG